MKLNERIATICESIQSWLSDDTGSLSVAIDKAVDEGHQRRDVFHRLREVERTVTKDALKKWAENAGVTDEGVANKETSRILCLHSGNLPLVGLQDIIAVLVSGFGFTGKISRRDAALTTGMLQSLSEHGFSDTIIFDTNLSYLSLNNIDGVLFSGSEETVPEVWKQLHELGCECQPENRLIRTAAYSIAWMERCSDSDFHNLSESILRYQGNGCRSVKAILSPYGLDEVEPQLRAAIENRMDENDPSNNEMVQREFAFARATGKAAIPAGLFLIRSDEDLPQTPCVITWIKGNRELPGKILEDQHHLIQNLYVEDDQVIDKHGLPAEKCDLLANAQSPGIDWRPDGTDPLKWLAQLASGAR